MSLAKHISQNINGPEQLLQEQKCSIRQLSVRSGVPYATCYNLVKKQNITNMTVANFHKIATSLDMTMDDLFALTQKIST